jgi:predicted Kef-type K+ transport protein
MSLDWIAIALGDVAWITIAFLMGFALSFSSTVFVVKLLEDRGEINSLHGRISVGVLIVQDIEYRIFKRYIARIPHVLNVALIQHFGQFTLECCSSWIEKPGFRLVNSLFHANLDVWTQRVLPLPAVGSGKPEL